MSYPVAVLLHLVVDFVALADESQPETVLALVVGQALQTLVAQALQRLHVAHAAPNSVRHCTPVEKTVT